MGAHTFGRDGLLYALQGGAVIPDPGDGKTINIDRSFGVCELTVGASNETRLLPDPTVGANGMGVGTTIDFVLNNTSGGYVEIALSSYSWILAAEGDHVRLQVQTVNSLKRWVAFPYFSTIGGSSGEPVITATPAEITRATDPSSRVVTTTATTLSLTVTEHGDRIVLVNTNSTVENAVTLPGATGSGVKFTVINNIVQTQGSVTVKVTGSEVMKGQCLMCDSTAETAKGFGTATATKINFNLTTTGGVTAGDMVEAWDTAQSVWTIRVTSCGSGNLATPFS